MDLRGGGQPQIQILMNILGDSMSGGLRTSPHFEKRRSTWIEEEGTPLRDLLENLDVYFIHKQ